MTSADGPDSPSPSESLPEALRGRLDQVLASILGIATEGIIVLDAAMRIVVFSEGAEAIFGYRAAEVLGSNIEILVPEDRRGVHRRHVTRFRSGGESSRAMLARTDIEGLCKDGRIVPVEIGLSRLAAGKDRLFTAIVRDVTDRREAEAALNRAVREATAANDAKSAFLAQMSHEIRTPLNGVLGMAQAMAREELAPRQQERLRVLRESGEALLAILNDILDISRIESGRMTLEDVEFDVGGLAHSVRETFSAVATQKGLAFSVSVTSGAAGTYRGDPLRLRQILSNLVSNALKFTDAGAVSVVLGASRGALVATVQDTGIGIPPDVLQRLFTKFEQGDASMSRRYGGTGLGLAICRDLAALMGGDIAVESTLGDGATFRLRLPLPRVRAPRRMAPPAPPSATVIMNPGERALRLLVAEDNPTNQAVIRAILEVVQIEPEVVADGQAAVEAWEDGHWDLILMDVQMPRMDGVTATSMIRGREAAEGLPRTPIVALTANAMEDQVREYRQAGMDLVVTKPIRAEELFAALSAILDDTRTAAG
ncbi:PAS domain-containing hybrid sensor histidine kinase/response regulator [Phenylobacterium kunshanense]|uniref:histidine kinase n=1 Tax=Phenylobacterium kunshanense TaxID=1445034 RepID=A0A328BQU7_9CAUL|nr:PAS domain-containing hybrid sensor histidine kinase/response regulator [Phenylobacterium kunshanense]RAK68989.1 hybrid sensor histidine kinase/response regulator [Phenylobacterium kunshanense]